MRKLLFILLLFACSSKSNKLQVVVSNEDKTIDTMIIRCTTQCDLKLEDGCLYVNQIAVRCHVRKFRKL